MMRELQGRYGRISRNSKVNRRGKLDRRDFDGFFLFFFFFLKIRITNYVNTNHSTSRFSFSLDSKVGTYHCRMPISIFYVGALLYNSEISEWLEITDSSVRI